MLPKCLVCYSSLSLYVLLIYTDDNDDTVCIWLLCILPGFISVEISCFDMSSGDDSELLDVAGTVYGKDSTHYIDVVL